MRYFMILFVLLFPGFALANEIVGVGQYVVDGDTFEVVTSDNRVKIRICGIDAPESGEPGSQDAWAKLSHLVHAKTVTCIQVGSKPRGTVCDGRSKSKNRDRIVAQCFVNAVDVAEEMVRSGHACSWAKFDGGYYQRKTGGRACTRD